MKYSLCAPHPRTGQVWEVVLLMLIPSLARLLKKLGSESFVQRDFIASYLKNHAAG